MVLTAGSFNQMGMIPVRQTCDGHNLSPQLSWKGVPTPTKSLVLVVENPDAPNAKVPSVHWILYNMPAQTKELAEGVSTRELPTGTLVGMNDWRGLSSSARIRGGLSIAPWTWRKQRYLSSIAH
ncbi:MAG: YbhB/YbcL family Raf kinase inhibitor-like protein [Rhodoferax sp.]|nr:YbhB/YbcL family Raf kinase inhibitor-like protein [Rhodoferax sp.]